MACLPKFCWSSLLNSFFTPRDFEVVRRSGEQYTAEPIVKVGLLQINEKIKMI